MIRWLVFLLTALLGGCIWKRATNTAARVPGEAIKAASIWPSSDLRPETLFTFTKHLYHAAWPPCINTSLIHVATHTNAGAGGNNKLHGSAAEVLVEQERLWRCICSDSSVFITGSDPTFPFLPCSPLLSPPSGTRPCVLTADSHTKILPQPHLPGHNSFLISMASAVLSRNAAGGNLTT